MIKNVMIVALFIAFSLKAEKPFYCEQSSYTRDKFLYIVGVAIEKTEADARQKAFDNGKQEIKNFFQKEFQLPKIDTDRLYTEQTKDGYYACRLLKVDISKLSFETFGFITSNIIGDPDSKTFYQVKVISNPANADLVISGNLIGKTDATLTKVSEGEHEIIVQKEGYEPVKETVKIDKESVLSYVLKRKKAILHMKTNISNGKIFINDKFLRDIKSVEEVLELETVNKYKIKLVSKNHHDLEKEIYINPNDLDINLDLKLQGFPGSVTILSDPTHASVYINDKLYGKTPLAVTLSPDIYGIRLTLNDSKFIDYAGSFTINPGEKSTMPVIPIMTQSEEAQKKKEEAMKVEKEAESKKYKIWLLGLGFGYGSSPLKGEDISLLNLYMDLGKKFYWVGIKAKANWVIASGGRSYKISGGSVKEKSATGYDYGIGIPIYPLFGLYVSPMIGKSSVTYDYYRLNSKEYSSTTVYVMGDLTKTKVKENQNYKGVEVGYEFGLSNTGSFVISAVFAQYSNSSNSTGSWRSYYNIGANIGF